MSIGNSYLKHHSCWRIAMLRSLALSILMSAASVGFAQTAVPHTFTANTPARAAEVNANFQALVTAINAIGARVNRLEGQLASADIPGTYILSTVNLSPLPGAPNGRWDVNVVKSTFTLLANQSFTSTGSESGGACCGNGTWSYSGSNLILTFAGAETVSWQVLAVGNLYINSYNTRTGTTNQLLILARLR